MFGEMGPECFNTRFTIPCRPRYRMVIVLCVFGRYLFMFYTYRRGLTEHVLKQSRVCICVSQKRCEHLGLLAENMCICIVSVKLLSVRVDLNEE